MTGYPEPAPAPSNDLLFGAFSALQSLLVSTHDVESFLQELAILAAGVVTPSAACGITARRGSQPLTVASSDGMASELDELQCAGGSGPCLESLETGAVVDVPDLARETRWGDYPGRALGHGARCSLSIPLTVSGTTIGALNLYGFAPHAFDRAARQNAETFAAQAATALSLTVRAASRAEERVQLERALTSRSVIDQALGILMAQQRCTADEAFALLRAHSQNTNRKLRTVAADIITQITGRPPTEGHAFTS